MSIFLMDLLQAKRLDILDPVSIRAALRSEESTNQMLTIINTANIVVLAAPLYADTVIMANRSLYDGGFRDLGVTSGMGYTRLLQKVVGDYVANEMVLSGDLYKGSVFREKGLVNYVLPKSEVCQKALDIAESIAEKPRGALETLKYSIGLRKRQLLAEG